MDCCINIRKAEESDLSRIAEIFVFNNRLNYLPIFHDAEYSFGKLQVVSFIDGYLKKDGVLEQIYVYDDGLIKGFLQMNGPEICKLYVEPCFQSEGVGGRLIAFAVEKCGADCLWALEKNERAITFYRRHGFERTGERKPEEGTDEYIIAMRRAV